jgi:hypothetical protein
MIENIHRRVLFNVLVELAPNFMNREIASASPACCHSSTPIQQAAETTLPVMSCRIHADLPETQRSSENRA